MGMVLYVRRCDSTVVDEIAGSGDDDAFEFVSGADDAWEADKMWWAAVDLLFGPNGMAQLVGVPITEQAAYSPVMRMSRADVVALAQRIEDLDLLTIQQRFDAEAFGDPMGPIVVHEDRDWICAAAKALAGLFRNAASENDEVLWLMT